MPDVIEKLANVSLFADDAKISRHIATNEDSLKLQETLERMHNWSEEWLLKLNISKCKILSITMQCNNDYGRRREPLCPHQLNKRMCIKLL